MLQSITMRSTIHYNRLQWDPPHITILFFWGKTNVHCLNKCLCRPLKPGARTFGRLLALAKWCKAFAWCCLMLQMVQDVLVQYIFLALVDVANGEMVQDDLVQCICLVLVDVARQDNPTFSRIISTRRWASFYHSPSLIWLALVGTDMVTFDIEVATNKQTI